VRPEPPVRSYSSPRPGLRRFRFLLPCLVLLLGACSGGDEPPATVPLAVLADFASHWDGRRVIVQGVVHGLSDPEHYWIEDDHLNRVAVEPDEQAEPLVGRRVRVTGRFRYSTREGRSLQAEAIQVIDP
jgi:hypothetical protein